MNPLDALLDDPPPKRGALIRLGVATLGLGAMVVLGNWQLLPAVPTCLFKIVSGQPCPGCGMTRSMTALGRVDVLDALRFHPLGPLLAVVAVAVFGGAVSRLLGRRDPVWDFLTRNGAAVAVLFVVALLLIWVVRVWVVPEWSPDPIM